MVTIFSSKARATGHRAGDVVVLAALGTRSALLVGFAISTSFMLAFVLLGIMGVAISNIVISG